MAKGITKTVEQSVLDECKMVSFKNESEMRRCGREKEDSEVGVH